MYDEYFKKFKESMDELMEFTDWISLSYSIDQKITSQI